ncbi:mannose-1-phosphate guanylyltransferase [bacterium]|nr:mannose-1-phosphate guanylyltransferase [bacterium]
MTKKSPEIYAVLLVGGKGERFWPLSTPERPKQFLKIFSNKTMIQETVERILPLVPSERILFVLPPHLTRPLKNDLKWVKTENLIVEPEGRNTAPAIALAARRLRNKPDAVMVVLPADHLITPAKTYLSDLKKAVELAEKRYLVTFGIPPARPETGYGYIEVDRRNPLGNSGFRVKKFHEKPDEIKAKNYMKSGKHFWNSGMFVWKVGEIIKAFKFHSSKTYNALLSSGNRKLTKESYAKSEATSVDYAIMEKASNVAVITARFRWDDVGSWAAVERHLKKGVDKNTSVGKLISLDSADCIVVAAQGEVALLGVSNLVIVKTHDTVLVCAKERAADIKKLLERHAPRKP